MLGRKKTQVNFFDDILFVRMIPKDHPLVLIKEHVDFSFVERIAAPLYSQDNGRPSYPPEVLFRVLFLEVWANLSDVQVCRDLHYNLLFRYFCDIAWDDPIPDDTTLVVFRRRLGEETFAQLFAEVVAQAKAKGLLKGEWTIVDGTKVRTHAAERTTLELLREGRRRVVDALAKTDPEKAKELSAYRDALPDKDYPDHQKLLEAERARTTELLEKLTPETKGREGDLLERIVREEGPRSFVDPEARYGFQKKDEPFFGYKAIVAQDASGIVTGAEVVPGNTNEAAALLPLVEDLRARGVGAERLAADRGYDGRELRERLADRGVRLFTPMRPHKDLEGGFQYDPETNQILCPQGKRSTHATPHQRGGFLYQFHAADCRGCPLRQTCLTGVRKAKVVYYRPDLHAERPKGIRRAMRIRRRIEGTFGEAKQWHRMERSRYVGRARVRIQVLLTMTVRGAKRMVRMLTNPWRRGWRQRCAVGM